MSKLVLNDPVNISGNPKSAETTLAANNRAIEAALEKTLSRDAQTPNYLETNLDFNSKRGINLGVPVSDSDAARWADVKSAVVIPTVLPSQSGNANKYIKTDGSNLTWDLPVFNMPATPIEVANSITVSDPTILPGDVRRYNIIPNSTGLAGTNTTALKALCDTTKSGPSFLAFQPIIGGDTYHFNDMVQVRPGMRWDLMGCRIKFTKAAFTSSDNYQAFLTMISKVTIENGIVEIDYPGGGLNTGGQVMRIGSRNGYAFGSYTSGVFEVDNSVIQGDIILRNLEIITNNPGATSAVLMLGGLQNVIVENVKVNGGGVAAFGIYYEYGWATKNSNVSTAKWTSSHMNNAIFRNVKVTNLASGGADGAGIGLIGAYNCLLDNIKVVGAKHGVQFRPGEALFYRTWVGEDDNGAKRCITLRNIVAQGITGNGLSLVGAEAATGYLSTEGLTASQQVDLMSFSLDGFAVNAEGVGTGISVSGPCSISNGHIKSAGASGSLIITDDCIEFDVNNVRIEGSSGDGIRANIAGIAAFSGAPRLKMGQIRNCLIAGGSSAGIGIGNSRAITISNNRIGYNSAYDSTGNETTQGIGISLQSTASGCEMIGNFITTSGGSNAYNSIGSGDRGNNIVRPKGTATATSGAFLIDGIAQASNAALADKTNVINTTNKYFGKVVNNTSNTYWMVAQGSTDVSPWKIVDNSVTLTPA